ncbi:MAG TPA: hypothetical protein VKI17_08770, partial [Gemmataceae bacterium]|nr:hypothetical protein [Gemmataceae bacterium]
SPRKNHENTKERKTRKTDPRRDLLRRRPLFAFSDFLVFVIGSSVGQVQSWQEIAGEGGSTSDAARVRYMRLVEKVKTKLANREQRISFGVS